ncbi:microfibrillar-associated protein MFAP1, Zn finger, CCHC type protein [Rhizoctonia solani AG-1 IA]|uniref:Microfibrillar-associated protein MFAP1, Zn finger, CCHC type protein n=1 Tax=Thanatephorus cucumeris (strain AG1-IA) TaxID=983506 RepID=L8WXG5_THACA|nr:microfibrillar-associated protein MFAP1, Zn finger, CCHC type protein [Rhizoctonia solani AG-1 IA]
MQTTRKPAAVRPAQAAGRYWKGKAPKGVDAAALSDSDSDEAAQDVGEDQEEIEEEEFELAGQEEDSKANVRKGVAKMSVALRDVEVKDGKVIVGGQEEESEESEEEEEETNPKAPGEESGSSEYESSSEEESEEEPPKPQFRPVFVPKRARETIKQIEAESEFSEEAIKRREEEAAQRKKESHDMVAESIKRELAEKETADNVPDVDDADGLDPAAEFEAWRTRELMRISREAEAARVREEERIERERRAALPEEQRLKEDMERADKSRAEKPKGQQKFLQKYWHKGAFHQDSEILKRHDFTEATESTVDASLLPSVMQVKNFGKRGQTKYTHLLDQDTTAKQGEFGSAGVGKGPRPAGQAGVQEGCFNCGGPHLKRGTARTHLHHLVPMRYSALEMHPPPKHGEQVDLPTLQTIVANLTEGGGTGMTTTGGIATVEGMDRVEWMIRARVDDATEALAEEIDLWTDQVTEMTVANVITRRTDDMMARGVDVTEIRMTNVEGHALGSIAENGRRLTIRTGWIREGE